MNQLNIGQRIKDRRKALKMSVDELAKKLGKNRATVYRYENGDIENLPLDILEPIATALQTTPAYLMGWEQDTIDSISKVQIDANQYDDETEQVLEDFLLEISEMGFDPADITRIMDYARIIKETHNNSNELHNAFIDLFKKMYELELSIDDLHDIYTYAQFIKSKKG